MPRSPLFLIALCSFTTACASSSVVEGVSGDDSADQAGQPTQPAPRNPAVQKSVFDNYSGLLTTPGLAPGYGYAMSKANPAAGNNTGYTEKDWLLRIQGTTDTNSQIAINGSGFKNERFGAADLNADGTAYVKLLSDGVTTATVTSLDGPWSKIRASNSNGRYMVRLRTETRKSNSTDGQLTYGASGLHTPVAEIPVNQGFATYHGDVTGQIFETADYSKSQNFDGDMSMQIHFKQPANDQSFKSFSLKGQVDNIRHGSQGQNYTLTIPTLIETADTAKDIAAGFRETSISFDGTSCGAQGCNGRTPQSVRGLMNGTFYGPKAKNLGGGMILELKDAAGKSHTIMGAYGISK